jgi:hypothetical protein
MADPVFIQSSESLVVTTSSLDNDPELKATWNDAWADIDAAEEAKSPPEEAPTPPTAVETPAATDVRLQRKSCLKRSRQSSGVRRRS